MKIIVISDKIVFSTDPIFIMLDLLLQDEKFKLLEKDKKMLKQIRAKKDISSADKVRLRHILTTLLKDKPYVETGRLLDINLYKRDSIRREYEQIIKSFQGQDDVLTVLISEGLDFFVESLSEDLQTDTIISESMLIADKKFTGEYNFVIDEDFLLQFFQGLKRENHEVYVIGDKNKDSYLLSLGDKEYYIETWKELLDS
jgi:phosphoserine phosphatase